MKSENISGHFKRGQSVKDVAAELNLGTATIWRAIRNKRLEAVAVGRRTLILTESKERWLSALPRKGVA